MLGGISIWQLLIVLVIVALIFGTKKLRNIGGDLGGAVKGFKKALDNDANKETDAIEGEEEEGDAPNVEAKEEAPVESKK